MSELPDTDGLGKILQPVGAEIDEGRAFHLSAGLVGDENLASMTGCGHARCVMDRESRRILR